MILEAIRFVRHKSLGGFKDSIHKDERFTKQTSEHQTLQAIGLISHAFIVSCTVMILEAIRFVRHKSLGGFKDSIHKDERFTKQTSEHQTLQAIGLISRSYCLVRSEFEG